MSVCVCEEPSGFGRKAGTENTAGDAHLKRIIQFCFAFYKHV